MGPLSRGRQGGPESRPRPQSRSLKELRADKDYCTEAKAAVVVAVPLERHGKSVRLNISIDERLVEAMDRAAAAACEKGSDPLFLHKLIMSLGR